MRYSSRALSLSFLVCLAAAAAPAAAVVVGSVVNSAGEPVEGAQVSVVGGGATAATDTDGRFELAAEPPLSLQVRHPRYQPLEAAIEAGDAETVVLTLIPKQQIYEEVVVSASRGEAAVPASIAATLVRPDAAPSPPLALTEMVATVPGVAENGQGGMFQTYSVRGVSRQRILTLVSGMRMVSERRAGVSASFIDPLLMRSVDVLRGPSSSYYGSGALGGVVQLFPRVFDGPALAAGYRSQGDEHYQTVGWGGGGWSLGVAHRSAGEAETPAGERLNSAFSQYSAVVQREWEAGGLTYQLLAIGSAGRDIGKPNTDFPVRTTVYPEESHLLARFAVRSAEGWRLEGFVHPNELDTLVIEEDRARRSELANQAFDFGFNFQRELRLRPGLSSRVGLDYFGRRAVTAEESISELAAGGPFLAQRTLDDGEEDEAGAYGAVEWSAGRATLLGGGRFTWQRQANAGAPPRDDTAWSGFAGLVAPLGGGWELAANLGTGLRFPSLSERFFTGVTGRGRVTGNPDLEPERSLSMDLGLRWYGEALFVSAYVFRNEIDDYIERVETAADELTFVNFTSGTIEGVEVDASYRLGDSWALSFGGHFIEGREAGGAPLADIPADRLHAGATWSRGRWAASGRWEHRAAKRDPGSGEKPIAAADVVSASFAYELREGVRLTVSGRNLLDEEYFNSADRRVELSPGRSLGLGIAWSP